MIFHIIQTQFRDIHLLETQYRLFFQHYGMKMKWNLVITQQKHIMSQKFLKN